MKITRNSVYSLIFGMFIFGTLLLIIGFFTNWIIIIIGSVLISPMTLILFWYGLRNWVGYKYEECDENEYEWVIDEDNYGTD